MMELQGEDGSIVELSETLKKELGRGPGIAAHDRSVSRRQVRLQVQQRIAGHFVVINVVGPNPICVIHVTTGGDVEVEVVKSGSQSSLNVGDKFSLSIQAPVFYTLSANRSVHESTDRGKLVVEDDQQGVVEGDEEEGIAEAVARWQRRKQERLQSDQRSSTDEAEAQQARQAQDVSQQELVYSQAVVSREVNEPEQAERPTTSEADTDVAKKFGLIVEGSEFERYGRKGLDTSKWNWRIGRQSDNDDDDDVVEERRGLSPNPKQKAKSRDEEDDDDWRGDSEGEKELLSARKRPSLRKKDVQTRSHNSDTRVDPRKKRKLDSTSGLDNASAEQGKTKLSRQATPSTSTKKSSKRQSRATTKDEDEEEDDDGEDLDGFLVDDVDEEDEEVADEEDDEWTDEDEEVEEEDEIDEDLSGARAPGRHGKDKGDGVDDKPLCKYGNKCFRKNKDHLAEFRH